MRNTERVSERRVVMDALPSEAVILAMRRKTFAQGRAKNLQGLCDGPRPAVGGRRKRCEVHPAHLAVSWRAVDPN